MRPSYGLRAHPSVLPVQRIVRLAAATVAWTPLQLRTAREVLAIDWHWWPTGLVVPSLLHLAICLQESDLNPDARGDGGASFGIHQLYQVAHPDTWQEALCAYDDYGYHRIAARWRRAFEDVGGDAAWADVGSRGPFIETAAPQMQGSIAWPAGLGWLRYSEALDLMERSS